MNYFSTTFAPMAKAIVLRFDTDELREALKAEARAQGRSLNKQILHLLANHPDRAKKKGGGSRLIF